LVASPSGQPVAGLVFAAEFTIGHWWMLDAGCWMLDAGCWMLDAGCWMILKLMPIKE
jgi:hypothetical protein